MKQEEKNEKVQVTKKIMVQIFKADVKVVCKPVLKEKLWKKFAERVKL